MVYFRSRYKATHVPPEQVDWKQYLTIPNTYYDRPRYLLYMHV